MRVLLLLCCCCLFFVSCNQKSAKTIPTYGKSIDACQCFESKTPCDVQSMNYVWRNRPFRSNECLEAANYAGYYNDEDIIAFLKSNCAECK